MELRQLEYFVAVAEERNFTRAAERVHISQSGVSAQIRQLELDLGAPLIDRSGRTATVTAAGAAILGHARAVIASVEALRRAVDDVNGLIRGRLVVGMVSGCTVEPFFDALASFHRAHPGVEISLIEDSSDPLTDLVRQGGVDVALIGTSGDAPAGVGAAQLTGERLVAAVPAGHPLARRSRARLATVAAHPIVAMPVGTAVRTMFDLACIAHGVRPDIALQASAPDAVASLAARGLGVAILTESMVAAHPRLHAVHLVDVRAPAGLALIWASSADRAGQELVRRCREAFADAADAAGCEAG